MGNILDEILESDEVRTEVSDKIYDMLGEDPSPELITAVLKHEDAPIFEGLEWGFSDTVVRENLMDTVALVLIDSTYPTYGDMQTEQGQEKYANFKERLIEAARNFGDRNA